VLKYWPAGTVLHGLPPPLSGRHLYWQLRRFLALKDAVGIDSGLPEQLDDIDWRKQICDTAVTFCALSGAADPSSVCANLRPPCDWHPGRSACSAG